MHRHGETFAWTCQSLREVFMLLRFLPRVEVEKGEDPFLSIIKGHG